jgi:hypothetical protein
MGKDGSTVMITAFWDRIFDFGCGDRIGQREHAYFVTLPRYADKSEEIKITDEMAQQGYVDLYDNVLYFCVTEVQYNELIKNYMKAETLSEEMIKEVTFTYSELFEDTAIADRIACSMTFNRYPINGVISNDLPS